MHGRDSELNGSNNVGDKQAQWFDKFDVCHECSPVDLNTVRWRFVLPFACVTQPVRCGDRLDGKESIASASVPKKLRKIGRDRTPETNEVETQLVKRSQG